MNGYLRFMFALLFDCTGWTSEMNVTGVAQVDEAIPQFWAEGIMEDGDRESFWGQLAGKEGSMLPIIKKNGPLGQKGDTLIFNTIQQLMGTGRTGEAVLKGFEEIKGVGSFTVGVDIIRHAVAISKKSTKQAQYDEVATVGSLLKQWMSRKQDNDTFTTILGAGSVETLYANSKSALASLNSSDGDRFGVGDLELIRMALIRQGATPIQYSKVNGRTIPCYGVVYGEIEEYWLNQNTTFMQTVRETWQRHAEGADHPMYKGAVGLYRNLVLYPYYSLLPIPQGTPLRPETTVYATLTTTATTCSVGGVTETGPDSENVTPHFTLFFACSGSIQVEDEIISYTGTSRNSFTGLTRGVSSTTAGQHIPDKLVTERNVASVIGFGANAVYKAMPDAVETIGDSDDYKAQIGIGIEAYYGQAVKIDQRRRRAQNVVAMKCYSDNPGTI